MIENAIMLAAKAHAGQFDKQGQPYIYHVLRVMLAVQGEEARAVAVLHDVIEDTPCSADDLRQDGFSAEIIEAIEALTRARYESYGDYIERLHSNPIAVQVKIADLHDNLARIGGLNPLEQARLAPRYHKALATLTENPS